MPNSLESERAALLSIHFLINKSSFISMKINLQLQVHWKVFSSIRRTPKDLFGLLLCTELYRVMQFASHWLLLTTVNMLNAKKVYAEFPQPTPSDRGEIAGTGVNVAGDRNQIGNRRAVLTWKLKLEILSGRVAMRELRGRVALGESQMVTWSTSLVQLAARLVANRQAIGSIELRSKFSVVNSLGSSKTQQLSSTWKGLRGSRTTRYQSVSSAHRSVRRTIRTCEIETFASFEGSNWNCEL